MEERGAPSWRLMARDTEILPRARLNLLTAPMTRTFKTKDGRF